ncbi:hypothetical protein GCM10022197_24130 [Microlunatus spumicola]|uniref:SipW-cognate class signal peptide n=1 Tax=Microlunatus spumicola TaxID=81499 RepID=A0ABP6XLP1_9ACTN
MSTRTRRPPRTWDRVRALLALGTVLGLGAVGTRAAWTDDVKATTGTFTTGTVDIKLGAAGGTTGSDAYAFTTFTAANLKPGSSTEASIEVRNAGTLPFTYALGSTTVTGSSATLGPAVDLKVAPGTCTATAVSAAGSTLDSVSLTSPRTLASGATETLCFRATLAATAGTGLQGQTGSYTYVFTATNT